MILQDDLGPRCDVNQERLGFHPETNDVGPVFAAAVAGIHAVADEPSQAELRYEKYLDVESSKR